MTQFPQINLNGADGKDLLRQYVDAMSTVIAAIRVVMDIDVHGRDYQTLDPQAYSLAHLEHMARLGKLCAVRDELTAIAVNIEAQNAERAKR